MQDYQNGTQCLHAGYVPENGEPRNIPIVQSTTFRYATSEAMGALFDLEAAGYFYTRLQNPTNDHVAARIAALEGGTAAMLTASGSAATFFAVFNIASCGDHIVSSSSIYGGSYNLFAVTMKRMGVDVTFVDPDSTPEENAERMSEELGTVKTGQVTYAVRDTVIDDKEIKQDDFMGIGDQGILSVGKELETTVLDMIEQLIDEDSAIVSIYYGEDAREDAANAIGEKITEAHPDVEVEVHYGGQPIYYYVISVE
mgnify:CR=1 FL=1